MILIWLRAINKITPFGLKSKLIPREAESSKVRPVLRSHSFVSAKGEGEAYRTGIGLGCHLVGGRSYTISSVSNKDIRKISLAGGKEILGNEMLGDLCEVSKFLEAKA